MAEMEYFYPRAGRSQRVEIPSALVTNVGTASSGVVTSILTALAGSTLDSIKPQITGYLGKNMAIAAKLPTIKIADVPDIIEAELDFDWKIMIDAIKAGIGQGVGSIHASLYETLSGANALLQSYHGLLHRVAIDPWISRWVNSTYLPNIPDTETLWFMKHVGLITEEQFKGFAAMDGWGGYWIEALQPLWASYPPLDVLFALRRRGIITSETLNGLLKCHRIRSDVAEWTANLVVQYPEPYRLAEMYTKGTIEYEDYIHGMGTFGLDWGWASAWAGAQLQFPSVDVCITLLRRGIIDGDTFRLYLNRQQIATWQANELMQLKDAIPPAADLITMVVREAFDPKFVTPAPEVFAKYMSMQGFNKEWSDRYWTAHWVPMPLTQAYDNLARGYWTKEQFLDLLRIADIHPMWREAIYNVAFLPPSIREQGYGYDVGVYTLDDIEKYARWRRLSPEDAKKSATAMVAYRTEAERNAVRTEYLYAFGRGKITKEELNKMLIAIKTPAEAIPLWLERAELYKDRIMKPQMDVEGRAVSSSEALTAFKLGLRDEDWTRKALAVLDWTEERIDVAIERAKIEIAKKEEEEREVKYRKLTLAQLRQMHTLRLITKEQMVTEVVLIGYSPEDAELLTEIYTREVAPEVKVKPYTSSVAEGFYRLMLFDEDDLYNNFLMQDWTEGQAAMLTMYTILRKEYPLLRGLYEKGVLTTQQFIDELKALEVPEFEATQLVKETYREIYIERLSVERDLTKSEIIKGVKNMVLTPSQGAALLVDIGYDENEAWYILAINKVVAAGDPDGYWEMRKVTEAYKKAKGEKYLEITDEVIVLEKQIKNTQAELAEWKKKPEEEEKIKELALKLNDLELRMKDAVSKLKLK